MAFTLFLTSKCNLECKYCFNWKHDTSFVYEDALRILQIARKKGHKYVAITGGEPFLHPRILDILKYAHELGFWITILTNGTIIDSEIIECLKLLPRTQIRISVDGGNAETHDSIRGDGTFNRTLANIKLLVQNKIFVGIGLTVYEDNISEIEDVFKIAMETGCVSFRAIPVLRLNKGKDAPIPYNIHIKVIEKLIDLSIKYKDHVDLQEFDSVTNIPIEAIFAKRCMAGVTYFGVNPSTVFPCELLEASDDIIPLSIHNASIFQELETNMNSFFMKLDEKIDGRCRICPLKAACLGGCLAEKISFEKNLYSAQPVCLKEILNKIKKEYSQEELKPIINNWMYHELHGYDIPRKSMTCLKKAPFWEIRLKRRYDYGRKFENSN